MNTQDRHPSDSTLNSNRDEYMPVGKDSFFINSKGIIAKDMIISTGATYVVVVNQKTDLEVFKAVLIDVFHDGVFLNMIFKDNNTKQKILIVHSFNDRSNVQRWWLIDWQYLQAVLEEVEVKEYCGCD